MKKFWLFMIVLCSSITIRSCKIDPCRELDGKRQCQCLLDPFYCKRVLYSSNIPVRKIDDVKKVITEYAHEKFGQSVEHIFPREIRGSYYWYSVECVLSDGSTIGVVIVGPDGTVYEYDHLN